MALRSLDDRILGEKAHNYCSSDEESIDEPGEFGHTTDAAPASNASYQRNGRAVQTGPKGVIEDWRRYKQLETEKRERDNQEREELCRKLAMTCKSFKEDGEDKSEECSDDEQFMEWYKQKRMIEIQQKYACRWAKIVFGDVIELNRDNFIESIEDEQDFVTIIIHIYDSKTPACSAVNGCIKILASRYKNVKFCKIHVREARMSSNFIENGLPTIIVYKGNLVIGNFVRVSDALGDDFYVTDLENFLMEYGILPLQHEGGGDS